MRCFFHDFALLVKLSPSFSPHLSISTEEMGQRLIFSFFPGGQCFVVATWADWTSNVGSVLGPPPPSGVYAAVSGGKGPCRTGLHSDSSVHDVTFINMDRSPVLCTVRTCSRAPHAHSFVGRKGGPGQRSSEEMSCGLVLPAVTLGMFCFLPGPLTFQEDIGSESFQEVLLLL